MMDKGINRLEASLDMMKLLTTLQEIQDTKNVLFDKNDNILLKLQQKRVLSSEDSESFSEKDDEILNIYSRFTEGTQCNYIKESVRDVLRTYEKKGISSKKHRLLLGVTKNHPEKFKK